MRSDSSQGARRGICVAPGPVLGLNRRMVKGKCSDILWIGQLSIATDQLRLRLRLRLWLLPAGLSRTLGRGGAGASKRRPVAVSLTRASKGASGKDLVPQGADDRVILIPPPPSFPPLAKAYSRGRQVWCSSVMCDGPIRGVQIKWLMLMRAWNRCGTVNFRVHLAI